MAQLYGKTTGRQKVLNTRYIYIVYMCCVHLHLHLQCEPAVCAPLHLHLHLCTPVCALTAVHFCTFIHLHLCYTVYIYTPVYCTKTLAEMGDEKHDLSADSMRSTWRRFDHCRMHSLGIVDGIFRHFLLSHLSMGQKRAISKQAQTLRQPPGTIRNRNGCVCVYVYACA